jgi:ubiquinone/menaquinone biosynthesis C-methylase UbiE
LTKIQTLTNYDENASSYDQFRRPSPIILSQLKKYFSGFVHAPILSIGCGTGRMEMAMSEHVPVMGLDRSQGMLNQAKGRVKNLTQGDMTWMPFEDNSFSGAYFMQSLHHVGANLSIRSEDRDKARRKAISEAIRVVSHGSIILIQRDPSQNQTVWFWKYFPKALETKLQIQPKISTLVEWFEVAGLSEVQATPINDPMAKRFFEPESPLDPIFRRSFSEFSYLSAEGVERGVEMLKQSIHDGSVNQEIENCIRGFKKIGGTVFLIHGTKKSK